MQFCVPDICHEGGDSNFPTRTHPAARSGQEQGCLSLGAAPAPRNNPERPMHQALPPLQAAKAGTLISITDERGGKTHRS